MKGKKMVGDKFYISPSSIKFLENYETWFKDKLVLRGLNLKEPLEGQDLKKWVRSGITSPKIVRFEIIEKSTKKPIGFCMLHDIDEEARCGKIALYIADPVYRYRGFGCEVLNLLCKYALTELKLHSVWCEVPSYNSGALSVFQKQGFREVGVRTHTGLINEKYYNLHIFELINKRF